MNESKAQPTLDHCILAATISLSFGAERPYELIEPTPVRFGGFEVRLGLAPCQTFLARLFARLFEGQLPLRAA